MNAFQELLFYRSYRTLTGHVASVDVYRHNGKPAIRCVDPESESTPTGRLGLLATLNEHLTDVEQRTWSKLLSGQSIASIAADECVKRSAIYARIRGNNRRGGMVRKNRWVKAWWGNRQLARHE